ncbi:helix-turn-helix domain-containing protein [Halopiger djelfimassiliensis]|uniref:helix-turn-helix domain-containing protein n=1 Tax=Halopiger djelfimassiliensis TaxID=1293047 RepID=UPI000677FBBD|nr:helix-turn-helix domain-containing protein [Halopiger djelfimassiliensis]
MRYLTVLVKPKEGSAFHPLGRQLAAAPSIKRRAIHHVELLADDSVLLCAEASGDLDRYKQIMTDSPHVTEYLLSGDDRWLAVSQFTPTAGTRRALELQRDSQLVIETPIYFTSDGFLKVTCLGSDETFETLLEDIKDVESITAEILEMGEYDPTESSFSRMFTVRQEEVLEVAVDLGYYTVPRQATLEDIAEVVGIAPATVGEHLRKVEARVFSEIVR